MGSGFVYQSDIVPLSLGQNHIDRVHKNNLASCFDCNSRNFAYTVSLCVSLIIHFAPWERGPAGWGQPSPAVDLAASILRCQTVQPIADQPIGVFARIRFRCEETS